jgi:small subunit ribosomal protein S3
MGQKVNPTGFRLGINKSWQSLWFAGKEYPRLLQEDQKIREFLQKRLKNAGIARIVIERPSKKCRVFIHTARPGVIIGKKGAEIESLRKELQNMSRDEVLLNIVEVRKPDIDAQLIAENVAGQLERRVAYRRAMKRAVQNALGNGAEGIRICLSGRLAGAEIARTEWYIEGRLPLHTLRADIDYGFAEAATTYGVIGIKVWINHGEKYEVDRAEADIVN